MRSGDGDSQQEQLAKSVAERTGLNNSQAKLALEATLAEIAARLGSGDEVRLTGFGKFSVAQRAARQGRNPQTRGRCRFRRSGCRDSARARS